MTEFIELSLEDRRADIAVIKMVDRRALPVKFAPLGKNIFTSHMERRWLEVILRCLAFQVDPFNSCRHGGGQPLSSRKIELRVEEEVASVLLVGNITPACLRAENEPAETMGKSYMVAYHQHIDDILSCV